MPIHPGDEERVAAKVSRELESLAAESGVQAPVGFVDRVMAAVAREPLPQPARAFGAALLGGRFSAAIASIGDAWRVVLGGSTPIDVRAQALALVLVVAIGSLMLAGGAAVGAMGLLNANPSTNPAPSTPLPSEVVPSPSPNPSPNPSVSPEASPSVEPTGSPEPTNTPNETPSPTGTDDHGGGSGGNSGPGDGGSGSGSGSGTGSGDEGSGSTSTPEPTATGTDDHGGGED